MNIHDDRTEEQIKTHCCLVSAIDGFMSGWGHAKNGVSVAVWACKPMHGEKVEQWVKNRDEMRWVNVIDASKWEPREHAHLHIYVVDDNQPALKEASDGSSKEETPAEVSA